MKPGLFVILEWDADSDDNRYIPNMIEQGETAHDATEFGFSMAWPGLAQAEAIASIRRVGRIVAGL